MINSTNLMRTINAFLEDNNPQAVDLLKNIVLIPTVFSKDKKFKQNKNELLEQVFKFIVNDTKKVNQNRCILTDSDQSGFTTIKINSSKSKKKDDLILMTLIGHLDTVYGPEHWNDRNTDYIPACIVGEKIYGPGVLDMKGGIVIMALILKFLLKYDLPTPEYYIKAILTHNEENGHYQVGNFKEVFSNEIENSKFVLSFETSTPEGACIISRSGCLRLQATSLGQEAHCGKDWKYGISAIKEAIRVMRIFDFLREKFKKEVFATVTEIEGGQAPNSFPKKCTFTIDIRYNDPITMKDILGYLIPTIRKDKERVPGAVTSIKTLTHMYPMVGMRKNMDLYKELIDAVDNRSACTQALGPAIHSGGGGDAAYASMLNIPVVDALGVNGAGNHTYQEWAEWPSIFNKTRDVLIFLLKHFGCWSESDDKYNIIN